MVVGTAHKRWTNNTGALGLDIKYKTSELAAETYDQLNELRSTSASRNMYFA